MKRLIVATTAGGLLVAPALVALVLPAWTRAHAAGSAASQGRPVHVVWAVGAVVAVAVAVAAAVAAARLERRCAVTRDALPPCASGRSRETASAAPAARRSRAAA